MVCELRMQFANRVRSVVFKSSSFTTTLTAKDAFGNTATGYNGTVHFTSTDGQAVLPADSHSLSATAGLTRSRSD